MMSAALWGTVFFVGACADPWVPTGGWQRANDSHCDPRNLESALLALPNSSQERRDFIDSYLKDCDAILSQGSPEFFDTAALVGKMQYEYTQNSDFRDFRLVNTDGSLVEGHLLIREGQTPRPLVIVQCGLQCDLGDSSLKYIVAHLRDTAPFHMLLLASNTGITTQKGTGRIVVGGFDEGRRIVKLARYLQSDGFIDRAKISRVIVMGLSLGGHAALYSGLYNSFVHDEVGRPYVSAVIAACPVVDLHASIDRLFNTGILGHIMQNRFFDTLASLIQFVPFWQTLVKNRNEGDVINELGGIPGVIARGALDYYKDATQDPNWGMAPLNTYHVTDENSFWSVNQFQSYAHLNSTPTFLWASADDPVVHPEDNTDLLIQKFGDDEDSNYSFLRSKRGYHCNFTEGYSWRAASSIIRNLVLAESPELVERREIHRAPAYGLHVTSTSTYLPSSAYRNKLQWQAKAGTRDVTLIEQMKYFCQQDSRSRTGVSKCTAYRYSSMDGATFGFADAPSNDVDAQVRTRWLNANVWAWSTAPGQLDNYAPVSQVEWHTWNIDGSTER